MGILGVLLAVTLVQFTAVAPLFFSATLTKWTARNELSLVNCFHPNKSLNRPIGGMKCLRGKNIFADDSERDVKRQGKGFKAPNVITPSQGSKNIIEKFLMMYTCKICKGRNAQMVAKVAYTSGMVVSTCKHCQSKHLIADNEGKLDMAEYGKKIEDYLKDKGETVQKLSITTQDLEDNYIVDQDGVISLVPKMAGQV